MTSALLIGLAAYFSVNTIRRLPYVENLVLAEVKPWACHACMSFWVVAAASAALHFLHRVPFDGLVAAAAAGVCFGLLEWGSPSPPPLPPPEAP